MVKISFTREELIVMREAIHAITIKGADSVLVGNALSKIYKGLEELEKPEKAEKVELPVSASTKK